MARSLWLEVLAVAGLMGVGIALRLVAVFRTGALFDELTYQYLGAYTWKHGFPAMRPVFHVLRHVAPGHVTGQAAQPFLYHPPFFFFLLGGWFSLWGNDGLYTARLLSVVMSVGILLLVYLIARDIFGSRAVALIALFLVALDPWLILINQAVYIENSQMILILLGVWAYWKAVHADESRPRAYVMMYALAGLAIGLSVVYKQIGVYLLLAIAINFLLTRRRHLKGHLWLIGVVTVLLAAYVITMHAVFDGVFDTETLDQLRRTFWLRHAPGLNYGPKTALTAIVDTYWIFIVTIVSMVAGGILAVVLAARQFFVEKKPEAVMVSWALAAVLFAGGIALKSPHYLILWLIPIYLLLASRAPSGYAWASGVFGRMQYAPTGLVGRGGEGGVGSRAGSWIAAAALVVVGLVNLWSFQDRFLSGSPDAIENAITYVDRDLPSNAIVAVIGSAGPELAQPYQQFPSNALQELYARTASRTRMPYLFVYWSLTNPIPSTLGTLDRYCRDPRLFNGFNDHVEVCRLVPGRLSAISNVAADDAWRVLLAQQSKPADGL